MFVEGSVVSVRTIYGQQQEPLWQMPIEEEVEQGRHHHTPGKVATRAKQDEQGVARDSRCLHVSFSLAYFCTHNTATEVLSFAGGET
jgi:hypothetical protein